MGSIASLKKFMPLKKISLVRFLKSHIKNEPKSIPLLHFRIPYIA